MKKVLVVGATGATGKLLVEQLLEKELPVKALVRSRDRLPENLIKNANLEVVERSISEMTEDELSLLVSDCGAVASCLGHNLSFKGIFGKPRRLVTDATRNLCLAIERNEPAEKIKFVLMNTAGNSNRATGEKVSFGQSIVISLLRILIPPHPDNEQAADYLWQKVGKDHASIEWAVVRPDGLIDEDKVTEYSEHVSPTRSAIFNAGKTSRINVANFMSQLFSEKELWQKWKCQMPVIYNKE